MKLADSDAVHGAGSSFLLVFGCWFFFSASRKADYLSLSLSLKARSINSIICMQDPDKLTNHSKLNREQQLVSSRVVLTICFFAHCCCQQQRTTDLLTSTRTKGSPADRKTISQKTVRVFKYCVQFNNDKIKTQGLSAADTLDRN